MHGYNQPNCLEPDDVYDTEPELVWPATYSLAAQRQPGRWHLPLRPGKPNHCGLFQPTRWLCVQDSTTAPPHAPAVPEPSLAVPAAASDVTVGSWLDTDMSALLQQAEKENTPEPEQQKSQPVMARKPIVKQQFSVQRLLPEDLGNEPPGPGPPAQVRAGWEIGLGADGPAPDWEMRAGYTQVVTAVVGGGLGVWWGRGNPLNLGHPVPYSARPLQTAAQAVLLAVRQAERTGLKRIEVSCISLFPVSMLYRIAG